MNSIKPELPKNKLTTIDSLEIGDRFFLASDKKKITWSKVQEAKKVTQFQTYTNWGLKDGHNLPLAMKKETKVVFLRRPSATEPIA
jgi:hypothetical protein